MCPLDKEAMGIWRLIILSEDGRLKRSKGGDLTNDGKTGILETAIQISRKLPCHMVKLVTHDNEEMAWKMIRRGINVCIKIEGFNPFNVGLWK